MSRPPVALDIECYPDYLIVGFLGINKPTFKYFELHDGHPFDREGVIGLLRQVQIITFNGRNYDIPMLLLALSGRTNKALKQASDLIITQGLKPWDIEREYQVKTPSYIDHIDLIEVAPGTASLKIYGGRIHAPKMQDLPYEHDENILPDRRLPLIEYNRNDLETTVLLYQKLLPQLQLRETLSEIYKIDLKSKSDAQIAEQAIKHEIELIKGERIYRAEIAPGTKYKYNIPPFIRFATSPLRSILSMVGNSDFVVGLKGAIELPDKLSDAEISIGASVYRMGIGGLHSSEANVSHVSDDEHVLRDYDVTSYYPNIILGSGLNPPNMGSDFQRVFKSIVDRRVAAKHAGDKVVADSLKVVSNSAFGKTGSKWSILYAPQLLIQVTLTGQLSLLMLIEMLEKNAVPVVSANTDGIVIKCPTHSIEKMEKIIAWWEKQTGFETEMAEYAALYSASVNSYIALKAKGGIKRKGAYAEPGLQKNPTNLICVEAACDYIEHGIPLDYTIHMCDDIRKFVTIKRVSGGGIKGGKEILKEVDGPKGKVMKFSHYEGGTYLGKAVRWYYAVGETGCIHYKTNGNRVGRSEGAKPLMQLPDRMPEDVDYAWYVKEAEAILKDIGAI